MENTKVGPFLVGQRIGRNRRQRVYRAKQTEQDLDVALKFIGIPDKADRSKAIEKIQIEVELLKQLRHPNLVKVLGAGIENDEIFFAYELVNGESLSSVLARRGRFAPDQVIDFGRQIAKLLDYLHDQDIVHSKLTPDKILIDEQGKVKVADLRLNRSRKKRWDSALKRELDIAAYMAPEQIKVGGSRKSDIYSLGVILYEMLTGKLPYEPDTIGRMTRSKMHSPVPSVSSQVMNCPVWLDKIVGQMISPDPKLRPHQAKVVVLAMKELRVMDEKKQAAISQVKKGFNPLTIGADRKEANKLLGPKEKWNFDPALLQSTGFLLAGLLLTIGLIAFAVWPESNQSKYDRAAQLMKSDDSADWRDARKSLKEIMDSSSGELHGPAELLYFESRRRTLLSHAGRGRTIGLQSDATQSFIQAFQLQKEGDWAGATELYRMLVENVDPSGDERHIFVEANTRLEHCLEQLKPAETNSEVPPGETSEPSATSSADE